ncbi:MAG: phytanoyl-CoA dioxygenase family protein [Bacteroidetes bacterium]|nr:phytanoyl-CoA dioxygenase family protein [Bacteroidota bacterium]
MKPSSKSSDLNPHQDSPIVDERNYYAVFVWVALCDINEKNGALQVLPKSHLWGNFQRSLNVKWPFEKFTQLLKDEMKPIYLNKGDIILFDSALIHSSLPNLSDKPRIAFNTAILPKNHQQVHYYKDKDTPKGKVEQYYITQEFYRNHNIMEKPKSPFYMKEMQDWIFPMISKKDLKHLIKLSKTDNV